MGWRDNFRNSFTSNGIATEGSTLPQNNPHWEDYMRQAFTPTGVRIAGLSLNEYGSSVGDSFQKEELPTASEDYVGKIYQYVGQTNSNYTRGYFYDCIYDYTPASVSVVNNTGNNTVTVNADTYASEMARTDIPIICTFVGLPKTISVFRFRNGSEFTTLTRETMYDRQQTGGSGGIQMIQVQYGWIDGANNVYYTRTEIPDIGDTFYEPAAYDITVMSNNDSDYEVISIDSRYDTGNGYWVLGGNDYPEDLVSCGIVVSTTPSIGDRFTMTYSEAVDNGYKWQQINVQPTS